MATRRQHDTKGVYIKIRRTHKICRPHNEHMIGQVLSMTYHVAYASVTLLYAELIFVRLGNNVGSVSGLKFLASAVFTKWHRHFQRATKFTRNLTL
jgi:hypothetical protein